MSETLREEFVTGTIGGLRIHAMLHLPEPGAARVPGVILLHGFTSSSSGENRILVHQARDLAARGIAALRFDFRGSGGSEGSHATLTLQDQIDDAGVMLDLLARHAEVDPARLGVLGLSVGGAIAGSLLGRRQDIRAMVLWAPVAHPLAIIAGAAGAQRAAESLATGQADADGEPLGLAFLTSLPALQPLEAARGATVPLLVVHGTDDTLVPPSEGAAYIDVVAGPRELVLIEGANHTFTSIPWRTRLFEVSSAWFARYL